MGSAVPHPPAGSGPTASLAFLGLGSEEALRTIAEVLPDGLFTTDVQGRVTYWNPAAARITGWSEEEAVGKDCSLLAGDAVHGCSCGVGPLRCGLALQGRSSKCCTARSRSGELLLIVKNAVPLYSASGQVVGALECFIGAGEAAGMEARLAAAAREAGCQEDLCGLVGRDPAMLELYRMVGLVASSPATVMILGESGSGKERVAEAIHRLGGRARGPFVKVSCAALNENLLESELFGHVKGAFTGALRDRRGRFEEASGGTLLLDEIGDISPLVQLKLLRVIEQRSIERVGDSTAIPVDVRLLCATHRDLKALVAEGRFRADLYFRLAVFPLRVPALREHVSDLPALAERFLSRLGTPARPSAETLRILAAHAWPGNVRELQNALEYAALQAGRGPIEPRHLPEDVRAVPAGVLAPPPASPDEERERLRQVLQRHGWNRAAAARSLGISRVTLWKRLKRLGLSEPA